MLVKGLNNTNDIVSGINETNEIVYRCEVYIRKK